MNVGSSFVGTVPSDGGYIDNRRGYLYHLMGAILITWEAVRAWGAGVYSKSVYPPINFVVTLILL